MRRLWGWVRGLVGLHEIALAMATGLISYGFWRSWSPGAFLVPGLVLLWIVLPQRVSFLRSTDENKRRK